MSISFATQGLVLIGAGPAGLAPLFAAASAGRLQEVLRLGVTILERGEELGGGGLGDYAITSDSSAETFLDIVTGSKEPEILALLSHPVTQALRQLGKEAAPLALVSEFLKVAGRAMCNLVAASPFGLVLTGAEAFKVTRTASQRWRVHFRHAPAKMERIVEARFVVLAAGAHQPQERLTRETVAGVRLMPQYTAKLLQSGSVLCHRGLEAVQERLAGIRNPEIVIVGGSTSAGSVAARLLKGSSLPTLGEDSITILHRQPLRIFYESVAAAHAENYNEFTPADVCPLSGRVNRFSGFRLESRELMMRARGLGQRPPEPRLRLLQLRSDNLPEARALLDSADLIVAALGYKPRLLPVFDNRLQRVQLLSPSGSSWSVVDGRCRVLTDDGASLPNLFAIGLAVGPAGDANLGGEANFLGQVNSLWMWQHCIGLRIMDEICSQLCSRASITVSSPHFDIAMAVQPSHGPMRVAAEVSMGGLQ